MLQRSLQDYIDDSKNKRNLFYYRFILKRTPENLRFWEEVKEQASTDNKSVNDVILTLLKKYVSGKVSVY